jgi:hypothetical protein
VEVIKVIINRRVLRAGIVLAAGLLAGGLAAPAGGMAAPAAQGAEPASLRLAGGETHCVSAAVPAGSAAMGGPVTCFGSFAEAISFATHGAVRLPAGAHTVTQQQLDAGRAQFEQPNSTTTSVVLGISYWDTGWTGSSWTHTGSYGCDTDPDVDWQNPGPLGGWDDKIGSARAYSNCTGTYWANSNFWGANIGTDWSGGVMNNATSSIQWS